MNNLAYLFGQTVLPPVASALPRAGYYYQPKKGDTVWQIAKSAYVDTGLVSAVKTGLFLLNDNPANANIKKAKTGWESYGVIGLQLQPKYSPGTPGAAYGSGSGYPLLWVPPLDGRTPDQMTGTGTQGPQGQQGQAGNQGPPGPMGPQGPAGPMGPAPGNTVIKSLIADYLETNPAKGGAAGPQGPMGPMGPMGPAGPAGPAPANDTIMRLIADYMEDNPIKGGASPGEIQEAVNRYLKQNPVGRGPQGPMGPAGTQGPPGPMGPQGPAGPAGTGGSGINIDQARDFVDSRIRTVMRNFETEGPKIQTAGFDSSSLIGAGILGGAVVVAMVVWRGLKR